jgi:predicted nucleic acid-binding OB-fold protein
MRFLVLDIKYGKENELFLLGQDFSCWKGKSKKYFSILDVIETRDLREKRKISPKRLSIGAKLELENGIKKIILKNEDVFVDFLNNAKSTSRYFHPFLLLPGMGKKKLNLILQEREKELFSSLDDFKDRAKFNVVSSLAMRFVDELNGKEERKLLDFFAPKMKL